MLGETTSRSRESERTRRQRRDRCHSPYRRTNELHYPVADGHFDRMQIQDSRIRNLDRNENRKGTQEQHLNTQYSSFRGCHSANRYEFREHYSLDNQTHFEDQRNIAATGSPPYSNDNNKEYDRYMRNDQYKYRETRRRSTSIDRDAIEAGNSKVKSETSVRYNVQCKKDYFGDEILHRNTETDYEFKSKRSQRWNYDTGETIFMTQNYLLGRSTDYKKEFVAEILNICLDINRTNIPLLYLRETVLEKIDVDFDDLNVLRELLTHHDECFVVHDTMFGETTVTAKTDVRLCIAFTTNSGCNDNRCRNLHICRFYILGNSCDIRDCKFGHSVSSRHNTIVLEEHQLQRLSERNLRKLITDIDSRNSTTLPIICKFYQNEGNCKYGDKCIHMHVCRHFIIGDCKFSNCKRNHEFNSGQPYQVLAKIGIFRNGNSFQLRRLLNESLLENDQKPNLKPRISTQPTTTNKRKYSELHDTSDDEMNERNDEHRETLLNHNVSLRKSNERTRSDALPENRYFTLEQPAQNENHVSLENGTLSPKQETPSVTVDIQTAKIPNELHSASKCQRSTYKKNKKNKERRSKKKKTVIITNDSAKKLAGYERKVDEFAWNLEPEGVEELQVLAPDKECKALAYNAECSQNQIRTDTTKLNQYIPILSKPEDAAVKIKKN